MASISDPIITEDGDDGIVCEEDCGETITPGTKRNYYCKLLVLRVRSHIYFVLAI